MIKKENIELVEVKIEDKKATLMFLDEVNGTIHEVNFNKKIYDNGNWIEDEEKAAKVEGWCQEHLNTSFEALSLAIGQRKDVYCYDRFNSLFEVAQIAKFDDSMVGQILNVEISEVIDDGKSIKIRFNYEDEVYESKMNYSTFVEVKNEWFVNPLKKKTQYDKFEEKFHVPVENGLELVGKNVMCEIKKAMGKYIFIEIKPLPKKKK